MQTMNSKFPDDSLLPDSHFYIELSSIEEIIYKELANNGSIIRIKSPQKMGKTSLVLRLIEYGKKAGYRTIYIDLQQADSNIFISLDKFLRWFCANISQQLHLPPMINEYWDTDIGSKVSCTLYFKYYILPQINTSLVLAINELNTIFEYPILAKDFLALLRSWHEEAKYDDAFKKLRLVLVQSTEVYINLNINKSPFNVGLLIELPNFTVEQIIELAQRYGLNWFDKIGKRYAFELKALVGGHPYLVKLALSHFATHPDKSFEEILAEAHTHTGIYSSYLRNLLTTVIENIEIRTAVQELINAGGKSTFNHIITHKLTSLGLIKLNGLECTFACELYRKYFSHQNLEQLNMWQYMKNLQDKNHFLEQLSNTDDLTQLANQRYFDLIFEKLWFMLMSESAPISLILLDIDHLKIYNQAWGREAGDNCLRQVADTLQEISDNLSFTGSYMLTVARYGGGEFAIIVPGRTAAQAFIIAETIRQNILELAIEHTPKLFGLTAPVITVSLGVASTIPTQEQSPSSLIEAARQALDNSKNNGRNCTSIARR